MFYVNDEYYSQEMIEAYENQFSAHPILKRCEQLRIAVCPDHTGMWIAFVLYVKRKGGSVLPLHAHMPQSQAVNMAEQAGCDYLFYQTFHEAIPCVRNQHGQVGTLIQFSSGTTGAPKMIERSWASIDEELLHYTNRLAGEPWDVTVVACPTTHSYGLISGVLAALKSASMLVIIVNTNPKYLLKKLRSLSSYLLYAGPTLLYTLARFQQNHEQLEAVMTSGASLPPSWLQLLQARATRVLQQYGCSEVGCISLHAHVETAEVVGRPLSHVHVTSGTVAQPEEIVVRINEHLVHTRDIGYINHKGEICFCERKDDVINVAGLLVYPGEVENVLRTHPDVDDVIVFKKQDPHAGERVCACFTAKKQVQKDTLVSFCQRHLTSYQVPSTFIQVPRIERGQNGKVNRKQWAEVYQ
ncbi:AMP-binding protein [Shouchella lonarensis]|uniref:Fatty-acyl-CoA synthase n=1 Tax=Shouchella lonarensis TaxID=1464122 RepID=A0A1G6HE67_9BACI|nr:AMP-binding protein [Shouchella lonarensis]SDB92552.1 fatty-acyl-CoA synthase [Shouchella lonarensis]